MTPVLRRVHLEDRADRRIELRVHQDDVLAVAERLEHDVRAELNGSGDLHEDVDLLRATEEHRVVRHRHAVVADRLLDVGHRGRLDDVLDAGIGAQLPRPLEPPAVHGGESHARHAVDDLVRETLGHEARADEPDANRTTLCLASAQCSVDQDHLNPSSAVITESSSA